MIHVGFFKKLKASFSSSSIFKTIHGLGCCHNHKNYKDRWWKDKCKPNPNMKQRNQNKNTKVGHSYNPSNPKPNVNYHGRP
jgi:hypothetical protein